MEWVLRFALGGAIVTLFASAGELFKPKTFSGLFGAAPSVAIATLALAFHQHGGEYVGTQARAMVLGAVAMVVYAGACVLVSQRSAVPVWLGAGASWAAWFGVALALLALARVTGFAS